ncbi:hypothetical protein ACOMICROBIO_FLGHMIGD_01054 [Vibrio sp. B1FLJ16]|nr:hypothetical protein ACOMICROBIO_FLGHMIGD_01054 [Vibrio sp. B1FLJ16]CAE6894306.1 hypothetical protein ACOMICROBIO_FLGHMIGD_01054 [Vibrio sp. B1FLJ16]
MAAKPTASMFPWMWPEFETVNSVKSNQRLIARDKTLNTVSYSANPVKTEYY